MWDEINLIKQGSGKLMCRLVGDFNVVRKSNERK